MHEASIVPRPHSKHCTLKSWGSWNQYNMINIPPVPSPRVKSPPIVKIKHTLMAFLLLRCVLPTLNHELLYDPMEEAATVTKALLMSAKCNKVLHCLGYSLSKQTNLYTTYVLISDCNIKVHL